MKKLLPLLLLLSVVSFAAQAQNKIRYSGKIEAGFLKFQSTTINVDPGPNWRGYNLNSGQNGLDIQTIHGVLYKEKVSLGLGIGYTNFEGINGVATFVDFEYLPLKSKLTPLINLKVGSSHIWNQYENGTKTPLVELGGGINYAVSEKVSIYLKSGLLFTQQSALIPIRVGVRF